MSPLLFDLLERRKSKFVLWAPGKSSGTAPQLILGIPSSGTPPTVTTLFTGPLVKADQPDLWELDPNSIKPALIDGTVYNYWFQIVDTSPQHIGPFKVTDPIAYTVDYSSILNRDDQIQPPA
jgi:hypothetical protein